MQVVLLPPLPLTKPPKTARLQSIIVPSQLSTKGRAMITASSKSTKPSFFERLEQAYGDPPKSTSHGTPPYRDQKLMISRPTHKLILVLRAIRSFSPRKKFDSLSNDSKALLLGLLAFFSLFSMMVSIAGHAESVHQKKSRERSVIELKVVDRYWACVQTMPECFQTSKGVECHKVQKQINAGVAEIPPDACVATNSSLLSYLILGEAHTDRFRRSDKIWVTASDYAAHPIGSTYHACINGRREALAWMTDPVCPAGQ